MSNTVPSESGGEERRDRGAESAEMRAADSRPTLSHWFLIVAGGAFLFDALWRHCWRALLERITRKH